MLPIVRQGSSGPEVMILQAQLNLFFPQLTPLVVDGLFGPLTRARVVAFQKAKGLDPDGIVGPKTWGALSALKTEPAPDESRCYCCGNGDGGNHHQSARFASMVRDSEFTPAPAGPAPGYAYASHSVRGGKVTQLKRTLIPLVGSPYEKIVSDVYGSSLFYDRIFFTLSSGLQNRAFTVAVPAPPLTIGSLPLGGFIQIMNLGSSPSNKTVVHEAGHVWQSQHHASATAYMVNCVACQGAAVAANKLAALLDDSLTKHDEYPANYPFSAYAYVPGSSFGAYGGEQIAQQIHKGEGAIVSHAKGVGAGVQDAENKKSLDAGNITIEDRRKKGVKI